MTRLNPEIKKLLEALEALPDEAMRARVRRAIEGPQVAAQRERTAEWDKPGRRSFFDHPRAREEVFRLMDARGDFAGSWQMQNLREQILDFINEQLAREPYAPKPEAGRLQLRNVVKDWRQSRLSQSSR